MFGRSRKKREAELRQKTSVYIPALTAQDRHELDLFSSSPHAQLRDAIKEGSVAKVFEIMCQGFYVHREAETLSNAVESKNIDVLKLLLETGSYRHKQTGLYLKKAITKGNDKAVSLLLEHGSEVDSSCVLESLKQGNNKQALELLEYIPDRLQELTVRTVYLQAIRHDMGEAVLWVRENHKDILQRVLRSELTDAVLETGRQTLEALGKKGLERVNMDRVAKYFIKNDKFDELSYIVSTCDKQYEYDRMLSYAVQYKNPQMVSLLRQKGGEITSQTVILDMLQHSKEWNSNGENAKEAIRRRHLLEHVDELTKYNSRLLLYMIRNNKNHTVKHLLEMEDDWSKDVIKDGILFTATNGYISTLESLMLNSTAWDAETYHKALDAAPTDRIRYRIEKAKDKVLGKEWQVEGDDTVRREQVFTPIDGSSRSNDIRLTTIFNFKSCEVIRIVKNSSNSNAVRVTQKNFKDYQNDAEIHEAYNKLAKFSKNPEKFYGAGMASHKMPTRRIIKRSSNNRKP